MRTVLASLFLLACNPPAQVAVPGAFQPSGEVLLKVNGGPQVTQDMVDAVTRLMPANELEKRKENGSYTRMVEQIGLGEVLYARALEKKLHEDPAVLKSLQMNAREVLAQEYVHREMVARVTDEAIKAYYDERAVQYMKPQARARHILVKEEALAKDLLAKIEAGGDFATLAKENTIDARTRNEGGDLGWFAREKLTEEVAKVAFEAEIGTRSIVETRFGFHIIEPTARRDGIPLEEVREEIEMELRKKSYEAVIEEVKSSLTYERFGEVLEIHNKTDPWGVNPAPGMGAPGGAPPHGAPGGPPPHGAPGGSPPPAPGHP